MNSMKEQRPDLDSYCLDTISYIVDLVNKMKQSLVEKLDDFVQTIKGQINQHQKNFLMIKNNLDFTRIFVELKDQTKKKIEYLHFCQKQINDINGDIIIKSLVQQIPGQSLSSLYIQEIELFNNNQQQVQFGQDKFNNQQEQTLIPIQYWSDEKMRLLIYTCEKCQKVFEGIIEFRTHIKIRHSYRYLYKCDQCNIQYSHALQIAQHCFEQHSRINQDVPGNIHVQKPQYFCRYTNENFQSNSKLAHHIFRTLQYHSHQPDQITNNSKNKVEDHPQKQNLIQLEENMVS